MKITIDIISLFTGDVIGTLPFWLLASDLTDLSEAKSSGVGVLIVGLVAGLVETLRKRKNGK